VSKNVDYFMSCFKSGGGLAGSFFHGVGFGASALGIKKFLMLPNLNSAFRLRSELLAVGFSFSVILLSAVVEAEFWVTAFFNLQKSTSGKLRNSWFGFSGFLRRRGSVKLESFFTLLITHDSCVQSYVKQVSP